MHHDVGDSGGGEGGRGLVADGGVGSVVVVVDEPALEVVGALGFAGPGSGVGELGAQGPVYRSTFPLVCGWWGRVKVCRAPSGRAVSNSWER